jgi:hypothetical protein
LNAKSRTAARSTNTPATVGEANISEYVTPLTLAVGMRCWVHHAHTVVSPSTERVDISAFAGTIAYVNPNGTVNVGFLDHAGAARSAMFCDVLAAAPPVDAVDHTGRPFVTLA